MLQNDQVLHASGFVDFLADRDAHHEIAGIHDTRIFTQNGHVIRIPLGDGLALLGRGAIPNGQHTAQRHGMALQFTTILVVHAKHTVFIQHNVVAVWTRNRIEILVLEYAVVLDENFRLFEGAAGGTTDMEGPHRQLGARFADGLGRNDASGLAQNCRTPVGQVAPVALGANAAP